jgi:hypothetical protein
VPTTRFEQYQVDASKARDMVGLGQAVYSMTTGTVDPSDMFRAALVQGVAGLDRYVHGVVFDLLVSSLLGQSTNLGRSRVGISFDVVAQFLSTPDGADRELLIRTHVAQRLTKETFQRAEAIADAYALAGTPKIWAKAMGADAADMRTALGVVVERRNKIVHSCDADLGFDGGQVGLDDSDALQALGTISTVVEKLDFAMK